MDSYFEQIDEYYKLVFNGVHVNLQIDSMLEKFEKLPWDRNVASILTHIPKDKILERFILNTNDGKLRFVKKEHPSLSPDFFDLIKINDLMKSFLNDFMGRPEFKNKHLFHLGVIQDDFFVIPGHSYVILSIDLINTVIRDKDVSYESTVYSIPKFEPLLSSVVEVQIEYLTLV